MRIRNFTAHSLCFYHESDVDYVINLRKHYVSSGAFPYLIVPAEGMLSVEFEDERIDILDSPVPTYRKLVKRLDRLPTTEPDDMLVVSAVFASYRYLTDTSHIPLYCIKDTVYNDNGSPVGCLGLCRA